MAYQALYRVWRSQRFDDIVGQKAITQTLKNAIIHKQTSHAYLFSGPRGTGKTSAAKIFAKAINCPNNHDGEPCNECEMCLSITQGRQEDVIEIDAASNNGVEEIRFIRDRANYAPTNATYKVYIIDEVHMLSTGAFNALLKTLEEPKENVVFILATTEPHKIPATIISRTQRFDFKRIQTADIVEHLEKILQTQELAYEPAALQVIAKAAEGGMRDALSILDQAISYSDETITLQDAIEVTGSLTFDMMDRYLKACFEKDTARALASLEAILAEGKEARRLLEDLLLYCRDLLVYQQAPQLLLEKSAQVTEAFKELAAAALPATIYQTIQILSDTQNEVRFTNHAAIYLEVATVKLSSEGIQGATSSDSPKSAIEPQALQELRTQLLQVQKELQELKQQAPTAVRPAEKAPTKTVTTYRIPTEQVYQVLQHATKKDLANVKNVWEDLLATLYGTQKAMMRASEPIAAGPNSLLIVFDYEIVCQRAAANDELKTGLSNSLSVMVPNYAPDLVFIPRDAWPDLRRSFLNQSHSQPAEALTTPEELTTEVELLPEETPEVTAVEQAKSLFGDIVTITDD